jgi:hypothetical protein
VRHTTKKRRATSKAKAKKITKGEMARWWQDFVKRRRRW